MELKCNNTLQKKSLNAKDKGKKILVKRRRLMSTPDDELVSGNIIEDNDHPCSMTKRKLFQVRKNDSMNRSALSSLDRSHLSSSGNKYSSGVRKVKATNTGNQRMILNCLSVKQEPEKRSYHRPASVSLHSTHNGGYSSKATQNFMRQKQIKEASHFKQQKHKLTVEAIKERGRKSENIKNDSPLCHDFERIETDNLFEMIDEDARPLKVKTFNSHGSVLLKSKTRPI